MAARCCQRRFIAVVAAARRKASRQRGGGATSARKAVSTVLYKDGESIMKSCAAAVCVSAVTDTASPSADDIIALDKPQGLAVHCKQSPSLICINRRRVSLLNVLGTRLHVELQYIAAIQSWSQLFRDSLGWLVEFIAKFPSQSSAEVL